MISQLSNCVNHQIISIEPFFLALMRKIALSIQESILFIDPALKRAAPQISQASDHCSIYSLIHPDDRLCFFLALQEALILKKDLEAEYRLIAGDQTIHWVKEIATISCENGYFAIKGALLKANKKKEDEKRLRMVTESLPNIVWTAQPNGAIDYYNHRWLEFTGAHFEECFGSGWGPFIHPDDLTLTLDRWYEAIKSKTLFQIEQRLKSADGSYRWHLARALPLKDGDGQVIKWFGTSTDISELKWVNEERERLLLLEKARAKQLQTLAETSIAINACLDVEEIIEIAANCIQMTIAGCSAQIQVDDFSYSYRPIQATSMAAESGLESGLQLVKAAKWPLLCLPLVISGQKRIGFIEIFAAPLFIFSENDLSILTQIAQIVAIAIDKARLYLEKQQAAAQAKEAMRAAELANATKSAFLANMSHEIRTPLGAILGFAEFLAKLSDNSVESAIERLQFMEIIRRNGRLLTSLIDDILDLSKVEAGLLQVDREQIYLIDLLSEIYTLLKPRAKEKELKFDFYSLQPLPEIIISDPTRLRQILINVIGNAIKFTEKGLVEVEVKLQLKEQASNLLFIVKDTGIGMKGEHIGRLFHPFMQADDSTSRKYGGSGLGLALSKRLVCALGGDMQLIESIPGKGSIFQIAIDSGKSCLFKPLAPFSLHNRELKLTIPKTSMISLKGIKILLCEDAPDNQLLIGQILAQAGAQVEIAGDGIEGLEKARKGAFDIILLDIQMPKLEGTAVVRKLRDEGYYRPIIALTAHAMAQEREKSLSAGCNEHITKPIDQKHLLETIEKFSRSFSSPLPVEEDRFANWNCNLGNDLSRESALQPTDPHLQNFFLQLLPQRLSELKLEFLKGNLTKVSQIAHQLRGTAASYGFMPLGVLAAQIEESIQAFPQTISLFEMAHLIHQLLQEGQLF